MPKCHIYKWNRFQWLLFTTATNDGGRQQLAVKRFLKQEKRPLARKTLVQRGDKAAAGQLRPHQWPRCNRQINSGQREDKMAAPARPSPTSPELRQPPGGRGLSLSPCIRAAPLASISNACFAFYRSAELCAHAHARVLNTLPLKTAAIFIPLQQRL